MYATKGTGAALHARGVDTLYSQASWSRAFTEPSWI
ncbi:MAG: hypothetical protein ACLUGQ_11160 [Coprococcus sp.]